MRWEVVEKLKSVATAESAEVLPGLGGSFLDPRVQLVIQTASEAKLESPRAYWNSKKRRFEVGDRGQFGIKEFRLGEASEEIAQENRELAMDFARESGWIWDYQDRSTSDPLRPFVASTADLSNSLPGNDPSVSGGLPAVAPHLGTLAPPSFSLPGGTYPIADYALSVFLVDPNPGGAGRTIYSINGGGWVDYLGGTVSVAPASELRARVVPHDPTVWNSSSVASANYEAVPEGLIAPQITSDLNAFSPGSKMALVTIGNPNNPAHSALRYRIDGGAWIPYTVPFEVDWGVRDERVVIESFAEATSPYYLDSATASLAVTGSQSVLDPPLIAFDKPYFSTSARQIMVTLQNPNPAGSSRILYQIVPVPTPGGEFGPTTEFMTYTGPFTVSDTFYPHGFGIKTYAEGVVAGYLDSAMASLFASAEPGLFGGHLDLDTSTFIAQIDRGKTSAHTHDITGKYNLTTIDMFSIPEAKQIEIGEAITNPATRFKLTVLNGDLSPGLSISIQYRADGVVQKFEQTVDQYGNIDLGELRSFSLGGAPGTAKLEGLQLKMTKDVLYNAGIIPTNTGEVVGNVLGKGGEWRNGALTVQAVEVNEDGSDGFTTDVSLGGGGAHGAATSGLLWEATLFWHWGGDSYDQSNNRYKPGNFDSVRDQLLGRLKK